MDCESAQRRAQRCLDEDGYLIIMTTELLPPGTIILEVDDHSGEHIGTVVVTGEASEAEFISQSTRMGGTGEHRPPFNYFLKCTAE